MKWMKKYFRASFNKQEILKEIVEHEALVVAATKAMDSLSLADEENWLSDDAIEMECTIEPVRLRKDNHNGTLIGVARAHCRT